MQKISIITPSFNQGQFLEQTIDSVLSQNYPNLDYIIIDGASTDNSVEIIKKYEKHLHFWTSEKDNGQSDAINKGLKYASGDIINWLNSDDYYEQDSLKKVAHYFEDEKTLVVAGKSNIWKNNKICKQSTGTDIYNSVEKTIGFARIDQPETFFSKKAIDKMGFLNANLHYVMDREWWTRYLLIFGLDSIKKTNDILVNFRIHDDSKTNNFQDAFMQENLNVYFTIAKIYELEEARFFEDNFSVKMISDFIKIKNTDKTRLQKSIHYFWFLQASIFYAQNDYSKAKQFLKLINANYLADADKQELQKIKTRIKLLPVFIKKRLNKI